jgi:hypothetical protein
MTTAYPSKARQRRDLGGAWILATLPRPQQSRLVLSATGFVVSSLLLIWLLLLALLARPRPNLLGIGVAPPSLIAPFIRHQGDDLRRLTGRTDLEDGTAVEASIRDRLAGAGGQPLVIYLSAAGAADRSGSYFLRSDPVGPGRETLSAEKLIELLTEAAARRSVLLILDAGQVGSDRNLHLFGNVFLAAFKARLRTSQSKGLAVLCSCAPGQTSWESEADRCSVFGYYVARGLEDKARGWDRLSPHVTVRALANYVRHHVDRWVRVNRKAVQTPELLGDTSVNFVLPRIAPPRTVSRSPGFESDAIRLARIDEEWAQHHKLRTRRPYRHAPMLWRNYQEVLLRAERAIRVGATTEADSLLASLPALRKAIADRSARLPVDAPWSLAMLEKSRASSSADPAQSGGVNESEALEKALVDLIGRHEVAADGLAATSRRVSELPDLVEAQLLHWARTFTKQVGAAEAFHGPRGERLKEAQKVRRLAEQAAAADERVVRWVAPLVDAGDELRRQAQDALFVNDPSGLDGVGRLLGHAGVRYHEALGVGGRVADALDLVEEIESDLPDYGEWQARRGGGDIAEGLGTDLLAVMTAAAALAAKVQTLPADSPSDDDLTAHLGRVKAIDSLVRDARAAFDRLRSVFNVECESLAAAAGRGRWRDIDAVLRMPVILPEHRRALLQRIQSTEVAASLEEGPRSRDDLPEHGIGATDDSSAPPDPDFWRQALALARLEIGLLEISGAPEASLESLRNTLTAARAAINIGSSDGVTELARVAERIRAARQERIESAKVRPARSSDLATLIAADRALRVALLADTLDRTDLAGNDIDRVRRHEHLLWHGRRLLSDFDPDRARRLFKAASLHCESQALADASSASIEMDQARLSLTTEADDPFTVPARSERSLGVRFSAVGSVPPGQAAILVGYDPSRLLTVTEQASRRDARDGVLVDVGRGPARDSRATTFIVARTEPGPISVDTEVIPQVFYRGRLVNVDRGVAVSLMSSKDPVSITMGQSYRNLRFKDFNDQFKEHPGQGYLHYGTNLQYKLILKAAMPVRAVVRYGLTDHPKSFKEETVELDMKRPCEIHDVVKGDDFRIDRANGKLVIPPLNLEVAVSKDRVNGPPLGQARYTFRMIRPEEYIETKSDFDPIQRILTLLVTHLGNDKATGPVEVVASIGGEARKLWIPRSRWASFQLAVPAGEKNVRWRVGIESMPQAFTGEVETPPPAPAEAAAAP